MIRKPLNELKRKQRKIRVNKLKDIPSQNISTANSSTNENLSNATFNTNNASYSDLNVVQGSVFDDYSSENVIESSPEKFSIRSEHQFVNPYNGLSLLEQLTLWTFDKHITLDAYSGLLKILGNFSNTPLGPLPSDARSARKTPRKLKFEKNGEGIMYHRDLGACLKEEIRISNEPVPSTLELEVYTDGMPPNKTKFQIWPVMVKIRNFIHSKPFIVSCYGGIQKPNSNLLCRSLIDQYLNFANEPFEYDDLNLEVKIIKVKGDLPAVAQMVGVKNHGGFYACRKCFIKGTYVAGYGKVIYNEKNHPLRTNETFRRDEARAPMNRKELSSTLSKSLHNVERTCFVEIDTLDMVKDICIDPMHNVLFGETKKCVTKWILGDPSVRLKPAIRKQISKLIIELNQFYPAEFNRKCRSLDEIGHFKGTELKNFLLYTFPAIMHLLPESIAEHFQKFHLAIRILADPIHFKKDFSVASALLEQYFDDCEKIYGNSHYDLNTHLLLHLTDECRNYEQPLFEESCFAYENELYKLKQFCKFGQNPVKQACTRLEELSRIKRPPKTKFVYPILDKEDPSNFEIRKFRNVQFRDFCLSTKLKDSFYMLQDSSILSFSYAFIEGNDVFIVGKKLRYQYPAFMYPFNSGHLSMLMSTAEFIDEITTHPIGEIQCKIMRLPIKISNTDHIFLPILHTEADGSE